MDRVKVSDLEQSVRVLNRLVGADEEEYTKTADGKFIPNPGTYSLSGAYGGWGLQRISKGGGCETIIPGYRPKREFYDVLRAYIAGISRERM